MTNSLMEIHPYCERGTWMFDDDKYGLRGEPLIGGMERIIERATKELGITDAQTGFSALFSDGPHPGHNAILHWTREGSGGFGNHYTLEGTDLEGWLCPALFHYWATAPKTIYCTIRAKTADTQPIIPQQSLLRRLLAKLRSLIS